MFDLYNEGARRVVVIAQEKARSLNHYWIGTEHMLVAILSEEAMGVAFNALRSIGVNLDSVLAGLEKIRPQEETSPPSGHIPFSPRSKTVLECALHEMRKLSHNYIGPEHLLLGMILQSERQGENNTACRILATLDIQLDDIRQSVMAILDGTYTPPAPEVLDVQSEPSDPAMPVMVMTHLLGAVSGNSVLHVEFDHTLSPAEIERIGAAIAEALT